MTTRLRIISTAQGFIVQRRMFFVWWNWTPALDRHSAAQAIFYAWSSPGGNRRVLKQYPMERDLRGPHLKPRDRSLGFPLSLSAVSLSAFSPSRVWLWRLTPRPAIRLFLARGRGGCCSRRCGFRSLVRPLRKCVFRSVAIQARCNRG